MVKQVYDKVLKDVCIENNGQKYAWAIPISLPVTKELASSLKVGQQVRLTDSAGNNVGALSI